MSSWNFGTKLRKWRKIYMQFCSWRLRRKRCNSRKPRWGCVEGSGPQGPLVSTPHWPLWSPLSANRLSEPQAFAGNGFLQLSRYILSDVSSMAVILLLSPQINTAKRLLEKGKEAQNHEPERSWFQTKEERKKEKSMLGSSSKAKHRIHRTQQFHSSI